MNARARKIAAHEKYAASAFKRHMIAQHLNQGLFRHWRCADPDSGNHAFNVTTIPGRIIVTGDNGTMVWERCDDMIPWCRGAINSIEYFAEKVSSEIPTSEWDSDVAREWIEEEIKEEREMGDDADADRLEKWCDLLDLLQGDEVSDGEFYRALSDSGLIDGCDFPDCSNYTSNFLWCREDLKWFLANLPQEQSK